MNRKVIGLGLLVVAILVIVSAIVMLAPFGEDGGGNHKGGNGRGLYSASDIQSNNRGLGLMEKFEYREASKVFEQLLSKNPEWVTPKLNLAIALINLGGEAESGGSGQGAGVANFDRAEVLLNDVISRDPENARGHYTLGYLLQYQGRAPEALPHFKLICEKLVPTDAHSWVRFGETQAGDELSDERIRCYEQALEINPNIRTALYKLFLEYRRSADPERAAKIRERFQDLTNSLNYTEVVNDYLWAGPLAEAAGSSVPPARANGRPLPIYTYNESISFDLASGSSWASSKQVQELAGRQYFDIRSRFGAGWLLADIDDDGDSDLIALGAIIHQGAIRNAIFRNDGNAGFKDVTAVSGMLSFDAAIGGAVGDLDADNYPDIVITSLRGVTLLRNSGGSRFEDFTEEAGLQGSPGPFLSPLIIDVEHDSDLDIVLTHSVDEGASTPSSVVYFHQGKARTVSREGGDEKQAPLELRFSSEGVSDVWSQKLRTVFLLAGDFDDDRDIDFLELNEGGPSRVLFNERLGVWSSFSLPQLVGDWTGGVVSDFNNDGFVDVALSQSAAPPIVLANTSRTVDRGIEFSRLPQSALDSCRQVSGVDADMDGWIDLAGVTNGGKVILGLNRSRGMMLEPDWVQPLLEPKGVATTVLQLIREGSPWPDLLVVHSGAEPTYLSSTGNGNNWLAVDVRGTLEHGVVNPTRKTMRSNTDGIGTRIIVHSGDQTSFLCNTSGMTGMARSLQPMVIGLGQNERADTVRIRWPDGVEQAELNMNVNKVTTVTETQRRSSSCPLLFAWDGRRFAYVTDFLGGGGIGYLVAPGVCSVPDPDEDVKIPAGLIKPTHDGKVILKIAEPMDEVTYLDSAVLEVIDHPTELEVYPNERFTPSAVWHSGGRLIHGEKIHPSTAVDQDGRDVTSEVEVWDRNTVDGFEVSSRWIGYAAPHSIELDFGTSLSRIESAEGVGLFLAGWVEYPYSQTNWAAFTAGVELGSPVLEWLDRGGAWHVLESDLGYPAGLPRMMTFDLTGKLPPECLEAANPHPLRLRIRSSMEVYWDEIYLSGLSSLESSRVYSLKPKDAQLTYRGYCLEYTPDGKHPTVFDYHQVISVPLLSVPGLRTAYGSVTEEVQDTDGRFTLINAGDEVTLIYSIAELPSTPRGWTRSYILRSSGYCKDMDLFNMAGESVDPLPGRRSKQLTE